MKLTLTKAGPYQVEQVAVPHEVVDCEMSRPPAGVLHTTEGSFESALSVFREHYAPNLMVGKDAAGRVRILQFIPVGQMAYALENAYGGGETNRWARCQIELVGYSSTSPWLPAADVRDALAWVLVVLRDEAGIYLRRAFDDDSWNVNTAGSGVNSRRISGKWGTVAGWYGHGEIPENTHWDPGNLRWDDLLARAVDLATPAPEKAVYYLAGRGHPARITKVAKAGSLRGLGMLVAHAGVGAVNLLRLVNTDSPYPVQYRRTLPRATAPKVGGDFL